MQEAPNEVRLLDQGIEDRFIRACLAYKNVLAVSSEIIEPHNFSSRSKADVWFCMRAYYREFNDVPTLDIMDAVISAALPPEQARLAVIVFKRISENVEVPPYEWIVSRMDSYMQTIRLQKAIFDASVILKSGGDKGLDDANERILSIVRSSPFNVKIGKNDLMLDREEIYALSTDDHAFCFPTRITALDAFIGGLYRKELFVVMSPLNVGKSWFMNHLAVSALMDKKAVLYCTLEMSRQRVMQRILQSISGTTRAISEDDIKVNVKNWDYDFESLENYETSTLLDIDRVAKNLAILREHGGILCVREYKSGMAKVADIVKECTMFDAGFQRSPDLVIVDGLMDLAPSAREREYRHSITHSSRELRSIASEQDCAVAVSHQSNRKSFKASILNVQDSGESIGIMQVADTAVGLSQTTSEQALNHATIHVMRARNHKKFGAVKIWQNLQIGQFCQHSEKKENDEEE